MALLNGSESRDQVDTWAAQWITGDGVEDTATWWGVLKLAGIDLRHGAPPAPYLHDEEQIAEWLDKFRRLCEGE